ncbi:MAG: energy-coupling factor transporter transmembrane protein EcfT [Ruminococcaceae bacterium]|nr:energy-coupling factor transporter transmembrane protein EcfT [Oscillospiraceae bacterium]
MNIALGQYYPSKSVMHRLDPRMKFILAIVYIVAGFVCKNVLSFALLLVSTLLLIIISRIPIKTVLGSIKAILFIMIFTAIINIFLSTGEGDPLFEWRFIKIYESGLYNAGFIVIRIFAMIIGASIFLTYTTTPIQLTDAIERLFSPLKVLRVPVHEFAMMMTIALRFIPTIVEETEKIMAAQKARGANFSEGSVFKRIKALIPIIIPLFVSAFRRAGDLATAMTCRCYRGGKGRTRMTVLKLKVRDFAALALMVAFVAGIVVINIVNIGYTMN